MCGLCTLQYFSLLLIGFVGLVVGIVVACVFRGKITGGLHDILKDGLNKYDNDTGSQKAIDLMQQQVSKMLTAASGTVQLHLGMLKLKRALINRCSNLKLMIDLASTAQQITDRLFQRRLVAILSSAITSFLLFMA